MNLTNGQTVYFIHAIQYWDKPYVMKRHHTYDTKSVILCGEIVAVNENEFKVKLFNNNDFEKDGEIFVFHKNCLLANQNFKDSKLLGKWRKN